MFFFQKDISKDNKKLVGFEGGGEAGEAGEAGVCTVGYLNGLMELENKLLTKE